MSVEKEIKKLKQTLPYSDEELSLMKIAFRDNDKLIFALRKLVLQYPLSDEENSIIKGLKPEIIKIIKKTFLPIIDVDAPLHHIGDLWYWLTVKIEDKTPKEMYPHFLARESFINYLRQQMNILEGNTDKPKVIFKDFIDVNMPEMDVYQNVLTRNMIIGHTEMMLQRLITFSGLATETVEETKKRIQQNSNK